MAGCSYSGTLVGSYTPGTPAVATFVDQPVGMAVGAFCFPGTTVSAVYRFHQ